MSRLDDDILFLCGRCCAHFFQNTWQAPRCRENTWQAPRCRNTWQAPRSPPRCRPTAVTVVDMAAATVMPLRLPEAMAGRAMADRGKFYCERARELECLDS